DDSNVVDGKDSVLVESGDGEWSPPRRAPGSVPGARVDHGRRADRRTDGDTTEEEEKTTDRTAAEEEESPDRSAVATTTELLATETVEESTTEANGGEE